ncbi:integrase core domain-containing protein [Paracoccus zhejiangensis]|uniref:Uncharacterized protein n=1 Tax=Paracoccus zhejiangensis TaxID=1077935 RepID=A0A2H5F191_9RHOB|nr:hypothetical protein CX676_14960 [Paracoccus zhejiangensis]
MRNECLKDHLFCGLSQTLRLIAAWHDGCNHRRPQTNFEGPTCGNS